MSSSEIKTILTRLGESTTALIQAAEGGDHQSIEKNVEARAISVEQLARAAASRGVTVAELIGPQEMLAISEQAEEADRTLQTFRRSLTDGLQGISSGRRAVRGYAANPVDPSALDREG